jgi:hypothetical protein
MRMLFGRTIFSDSDIFRGNKKALNTEMNVVVVGNYAIKWLQRHIHIEARMIFT